MATEHRTTGLTYDDLQNFPDDNLRREIIDGELFVTPSPIRRHQRVVWNDRAVPWERRGFEQGAEIISWPSTTREWGSCSRRFRTTRPKSSPCRTSS